MTSDASFLVFDDTSDKYFIARRTRAELKSEFHDMEIGETRMLSGTIGVTREA